MFFLIFSLSSCQKDSINDITTEVENITQEETFKFVSAEELSETEKIEILKFLQKEKNTQDVETRNLGCAGVSALSQMPYNGYNDQIHVEFSVPDQNHRLRIYYIVADPTSILGFRILGFIQCGHNYTECTYKSLNIGLPCSAFPSQPGVGPIQITSSSNVIQMIAGVYDVSLNIFVGNTQAIPFTSNCP